MSSPFEFNYRTAVLNHKGHLNTKETHMRFFSVLCDLRGWWWFTWCGKIHRERGI